MKNFLFSLLVLLGLAHCLPLAGQDLSRKFGRITDYEIDMTSYAPDTSAVAVCLYENTTIWYNFTPNGNNLFQQSRRYSAKFKILKPEGVALATVEIPYHTSPNSKEYISGLSISAYNRVNGKIVETKLKNSNVVTERLSEYSLLCKFTIPEVRVGTVIEYRYTIESDYYFNIDPIRVQHAYPVIHSFAEVATPEYFRFNINSQGYHKVSVTTERRSNTGYTDDVRTIVATDVPALANEPWVWSVDDFRSKVTFELRSIVIPGFYHKDYTTSWESVNKALADDGGYTEYLKAGNPLKDETAAIIAEGDDEMTRLRKIHRLVLDRMNWNGTWSLFPQLPRQRLKEGSGSSADINFILNSALRDAGFTTTPILLNPRRAGRLPFSHPSIDNIRTMVLLVTLSDGSTHVLDGTDHDNDVDLIPISLMADRARIFGHSAPPNGAYRGAGPGWIDLTNLCSNDQRCFVQCALSPSGTVSGTLTNMGTNAIAVGMKSKYRNAASEDEYVASLEADNDMTISSYAFEGLNAPAVTEKVEFALQPEAAGDYLYMNATAIPFMTTNPLTSQERKLPVEFSIPTKATLTAMVQIPEGYTVEELPGPIRITTCENGATYQYHATAQNGAITIQLVYSLNRVIFSAEEYPDLHTFFGVMIEKNNSRIILKKI